MQRLIPNKTKVSVELFRGVTIGDVIVGGIGMLMLVLVIISNLPFKLGFSIIVVALTALLLIRLDDQPNYVYLLHILSFLGYKRHFGRRSSVLTGGEADKPAKSRTQTIKEQTIAKGRKERRKKEDALLKSIEPWEKIRTERIRQRLMDALSSIPEVEYDRGRLEQEMIFYIEKLDINEEKQRLANHLEYFRETMAGEPGQGKKLGFIAQEMGREINTTGSKSNQAEMQNIVVRMKDELEQIKEQVLNVL